MENSWPQVHNKQKNHDSVLRRHNHWIAVSMFGLAFILRWAVAVQWFPPAHLATNEWAFGYEVGHISSNLASGHGYSIAVHEQQYLPTAWLSPLYPLLLAGIFRAFGTFTVEAAQVVLALNCAFQAIVIALLYLLGVTISGRIVGLAAAALLFIAPNGWQFVGWVWPTQLLSLFLVLHVFALILVQRPSILRGSLAGATLSLAMLTDGVAVMILPVTLFVLLRGKPLRETTIVVLAALAVGAAFSAPWTIRNYFILGNLNPLRGNVSINLWVGNHPENRAEDYHGLKQSPWHNHQQRQQFISLGEKAYARQTRDRALEQIFSNPLRFSCDTLVRSSGFWFGEWWARYRHIRWFYSIGLATFSLLAIVGAWRGRKLKASWLVAFLVLFPVPYYMTVHGHGRYRAPIEPLVCLVGAFALHRDDRPRMISAG